MFRQKDMMALREEAEEDLRGQKIDRELERF